MADGLSGRCRYWWHVYRLCAVDESTNRVHTLKVLSRPDDPGAEISHGIKELEARYGIDPGEITYFTHGTTVGVNTVIQRKGLSLCLFCTENFVDVLEIARLKMPDPYFLLSRRPVPLVSKDRVVPIKERIRSDGSVDTVLDEASVIAGVERARALGAEGIVIAFINSYRNPAHEHAVRDIVARLAPELPVYCSADVWSIIREYERTLTAVIHGYVQPRVSHYLASLQQSLLAAGVRAEPMVTKSNGGVMSAELGKTACAQMILSGTASGVIGAGHVAGLAGTPDCMSLDIGGTSADVAFIVNGQPQFGVGEMIGEFPIFIPSVAVTSIGAGGGSVAWVDDLGVLRVGPQSAGSTPGPACYGKGGEKATITDALAVLGFIGQHDLGYDAITVDRDLARAAVAEIAARIERGLEATAQAIVDVAVSEMYMEVSKLLSRYGIDPRDFALQAFGGAGPMLSCFLAKELGIKRVVIPTTPGVLSALGGLIADVKNDFIKTVFLDLNAPNLAAVVHEFTMLEAQALRVLRDVECGFVSPGAARDEYGVVINAGVIDAAATRALRTRLREDETFGEDGFGFCAAQIAFEQKWTRTNYATLSALLYDLPTDWRFFVKHRVFESIENLDVNELGDDGQAVRRAFDAVVGQYPELDRLRANTDAVS